jgi:hypothetical protein
MFMFTFTLIKSIAMTTVVVALFTGESAVEVSLAGPLARREIRAGNLHVLKTSFDNDQFQMEVEGRPDIHYEIRALDALGRVTTPRPAK